MKKIYLALFIIATSVAFGQRHLKGDIGVGLDGGIAHLGGGNGFGVYIAPTFSYNLTSKLYLKSEFIYERANQSLPQSEIDINSFYLNGTAYYNLFSIKDFLFFNVGGGLQGTFSNIQDSNEGIGSNTSQEFDFALLGGIETEFFLTDRFVVLLNFKQSYQPLGNFGNWIPFTGGGFKINF